MSNSIDIEEAAAVWLARRDREDWSDADQAALDAWLSASTAHRVAWLRLESAWQTARVLEALRSCEVGTARQEERCAPSLTRVRTHSGDDDSLESGS